MGESQIGEVWNIVKDVAPLFQNGQSKKMPGRAFAVPKGKNPGDCDWKDEIERTYEHTLTWGSPLTTRGWTNITRMRIGVNFKFGGRYKRQGRYIHDAVLFAELIDDGLAERWEVVGEFGDAYPRGNTAVLPGTISVSHYLLKAHLRDYEFAVEICGTGEGHVRPR